MRKSLFAAVTAAAVLVGSAAGLGSRAAHADPVNNAGLFGPFMLVLSNLEMNYLEDTQLAAIDAAQAEYSLSTAAKTTEELKLIAKLGKILDKELGDDAQYVDAYEQLVMLHHVIEVGPLTLMANSAALNSGNLGAVVSVSKKNVAFLKKLDQDKSGQQGDLADYRKNPKKFRATQMALAKFCQGIIARYS